MLRTLALDPVRARDRYQSAVGRDERDEREGDYGGGEHSYPSN